MQFRDLGAQYRSLQPQIDKAIADAVAEGHYISGPQVKELEERLASYVGVKHCITCANGTDALQLALMAWGVGQGDAVFVPDFTFFSSGEVVSAVGATPVFVDVDERTFNLDPHKLEEAVKFVLDAGGLNPVAVVAVDLFGLPADYPAIKPICEKYGLKLLEDGAQGFGGAIGDQLVCSFGDISTTSFFPAKPLGCYGDGGAVFTDDGEWAALIRSYAVHGKGTFKYDNVRVGMNSRLDTIQAAVLLAKLDAFVGGEIAAVNETACRYDAALAGSGLVLPLVPKGYTSSWAQYTVQLPTGADRAALQEALKEQGVPTMVYYPKPMHEQKAFEGACLVAPSGCQTAERLCATVLSLPMGPYVTEWDGQSVARILREVL
ncbi:DegT/DnrJ/EryC1/StrS family aminotransferase [Adlercreutzia caecimuris]|uniref:DegT/DnrJ/EryC1/StrS family aminotransferase n=1 Tax=Adlercreutzia caecimuris TaxID=671266 RepID=UPI00272C9954|nr:DegT/DnrJ/EryC1/StrS aminotransferase family protein [Adlercreutzia caecimuris]